ncbi:unnamed protein product [Rotaria sordida]|uniref:Thioredoxin domain-containing protein n=1 Tax=Rotaria sordida TaxID=392033 RepID=A0A814C3D8_9BILA|nr:unnamed protein product [Rotaria sordida]
MVSEKQSQSDAMNKQQQSQSNRTNTNNNRRKHARNANKKRQKAAAATNENLNSNNDNEDKQEKKTIISEEKIEEEEEESSTESSIQQTIEEQDEEFKDPIIIEDVFISSCSTPIPAEKESILPIKQRNKDKSNYMNSKLQSPTISTNCSSIPSKQESILLSKPQANVAPVKQTFPLTTTTNIESTQISKVTNSKSNEALSSSSSIYDIYSCSEYNSVSSRFQEQEQQQQDTDAFITQKFRRKKSTTKKSSIQIDSPKNQNNIVSLGSKQQINNNNIHFDLSQQSNEHELSNYNGYSSESDILSGSPSTILTNNNHSSLSSTSVESQYLLNGHDTRHSLSTSNILLDKLVSIFDNVSFSSDEIELILKKLNTKQLFNKQDWENLLLKKTTNDKTIERILEETYHSQAKILALELQIEKNHVFELTKTNIDMNNAIKHLQQTNHNMAPYQQTILSYQMQLKRLTDENTHLAHQLHTYAMMPGTINELKQQQHILDEQLRQISIRNSSLEKEIADGERARKHAAEIYQKADAQKQERIEQMFDDLNKYKKIDKDLIIFQKKYNELKENLNIKLDNITQQRDELEKTCEELEVKIQQYEQLKIKYDQFIQNETETTNIDQLQQELNEVKNKNDLLRQRNLKITKHLNKQLQKQEQNQKDESFLLIYCCINVQCEIIQLTSHNISQYVQDHVTFIRFYSNWCPYSKKFEPTWKRFAEVKKNTDLHVAEIDCSEDALICSDHDIFGYPTMKLFMRGSGARYEGPRNIESLEAFYREKLTEDADFEDSVATKKAFMELTIETFAHIISRDFTFVVFFAPWCGHCKVLMPTFQDLARQMINTDGLVFGTVDCTIQNSLCSQYAIRGYPTLVWFEDGVEKDRYMGARELNAMRNYIEQKMLQATPITTEAPPVVQHEQEQTIEESSEIDNVLNTKTFTQGISFEGYAFVNFGAPWCSHCQKLAPIWNRFAQKFSRYEDIRILRVDCTASESLCRDYGIRAFPTLILFRYGESKVEYNGSRDFNSLYNFLVSQLEFFGDDYLLKQEDEIKND